jgi:acyl carrier protein
MNMNLVSLPLLLISLTLPSRVFFFDKVNWGGQTFQILKSDIKISNLPRKNIEKRAKNIIVKQLHIDAGKVIPSARIRGDLGVDSLSFVELIMALEEGFDIEIPDEDCENFLQIRNIYDYLEKRLR